MEYLIHTLYFVPHRSVQLMMLSHAKSKGV